VTRSIFSAPHFNDEGAAYAFIEARLWANGRICPHCGVVDKSGALKGKNDRVGLYKCYACRKKFTVKVGTIFEDSHIQMRDWLVAIHLICSSKKGFSANQLHRTMGITLKTAWFMGHRIREALRSGDLSTMGGAGSVVEIDETFIGRKEGAVVKQGVGHKHVVLTLVERGGSARSFHVDSVKKEDVLPIVRDNLDRESHVVTDEAKRYAELGGEFANHSAVDHSRDEYGYTDRKTGVNVNTNTIEGYYSIFKRGMKGVYQHCGERHLHRCLAEFDFRYSNRVALGINDVDRSERALLGVSGKRLTYKAGISGKRLSQPQCA
jgi:transposase-like protein